MAETMSQITFPTFIIIFSFLLILVTTTTAAAADGAYGEKEILKLNTLQWKRQRTSSRISSPTSFSPKSRKENGATILEMHQTDDFFKPIHDRNQKFQKHLIYDDIRVRSFQSRIRNMANSSTQTESGSETEIPITSGIKFETLNYVVTVKLGGRNMTMIVDTGSDLTWVQCQPCRLCYSQREPLFNPSISPSYESVLCDSSSCDSLQFATGNSGICGTNPPTCNYVVSYGDGSYTRGELGQDHLLLGATPVNNFIFGCGRNNKGLFGGVSGLMGLGRNDLSLISQTSNIFGGKFSYCLPVAQAESSGSLILGGNSSIYKNSTPISYARMISNPQLSTFYFLNLTGTSIGGVALKAPAFGKSGILIDSGTVITRLPPSIYSAVKAEFLKQFSGYPQVPGFSILDTCFNLSGYEEVNIPTVTMHFEGDAELTVDVQGIFYFVKTDASQVCLALASLMYEDEIGIIGNYQQRNTRVIYDTMDSKLGFARETCSLV